MSLDPRPRRSKHGQGLRPSRPASLRPTPRADGACKEGLGFELGLGVGPDTLQEPCFVDLPPAEICAQLLDEGEYIASPRTMYRILAGQRRDPRAPTSAAGSSALEVPHSDSQVQAGDAVMVLAPDHGIGQAVALLT